MDTQSIIQIRQLRDEIRKSLRSIKASHYVGEMYGNEQEYTSKGIVAGLDAILVDITALTKATAKFVQISTHGERTSLAKHMESVKNFINAKDLNRLAITIDLIKPLLRSWGIRHSDERRVAFDEHINGLQKKSHDLSEHISEVATIKSEGNDLKQEIDNLHQELIEKLEKLNEQEEALAKLIETTQENRSELENMLSEDQERSAIIKKLLASSNSHVEVIENFSKKIATRESQLENQTVSTEQYDSKIIKYAEEHESYLIKAEKLIESAKQALEYKTAEGLSAAFAEKCRESKKDGIAGNWILAAIFFVLATMALGIWIVSEEGLKLENIIARVSLLPILVAGAWFSAGQYVKLKNIAEDYAYKSVLTKSIVGFSDQLSSDSNKGEDYSHYIKSVLSQIHNDPLRKHESKSNMDSKLSEDIKNTLSDLKSLKKVVEFLEKKAGDGK